MALLNAPIAAGIRLRIWSWLASHNAVRREFNSATKTAL
jgi:hypothetical protein